MTEYIVDLTIGSYSLDGVSYLDGPLRGGTFDEGQPVVTTGANINFYLAGTYLDPAIVGFKIVGEFSGSGTVYWDWYFENTDYFGDSPPPYWPEPDRTDWSFIGLNNSDSVWTVSGPNQAFEYSFATSATSADPAYGGYSFATPLPDLQASLIQNINEEGAPFDVVYGSVDVFPDGGSITVHRFDLVLFTLDVLEVPVLRRYPRDDAYGFGNQRRNYPPPRRLRNYGNQP